MQSTPNKISPSVINIGNFDGVHKGHMALVATALQFAKNISHRQHFFASQLYAMQGNTLTEAFEALQHLTMKSRIITFSPHPATVLGHKEYTPLMINTHRQHALEILGVDDVHVLPFNEEFAKQNSESFCLKLMDDYAMRILVIGHDFRMGYDRAGKEKLMDIGKRKGFFVYAFDEKDAISVENPISKENSIISSTKIRQALQAGDTLLANAMLGKSHIVQGTVTHGQGRGSSVLGIPTANLLEDVLVVPKNGVYATTCRILDKEYEGTTYLGVTNIGHNPTFGGQSRSIETHLLDFKGDIYGLPLEIAFYDPIRMEKAFANVDDLRDQVHKDIIFRRSLPH